MISARDMEEFMDYLENCTDTQVLGVLEKEKAAKRKEYIVLAEKEAERRSLYWIRDGRN